MKKIIVLMLLLFLSVIPCYAEEDNTSIISLTSLAISESQPNISYPSNFDIDPITLQANIISIDNGTLFYRVDGKLNGKAVADLWEIEHYFNFEANNINTIHLVLSIDKENLSAVSGFSGIVEDLSKQYNVIVEVLGDAPILLSFLKLVWEDGKNITVFDRDVQY